MNFFKNSPFVELHQTIKKQIGNESGILDLFHLLRYFYIQKILGHEDFYLWFNNIVDNYQFEDKYYVENCLSNNVKEKLIRFIKDENLFWDDCKFHEKYRITTKEGFIILLIEFLREASLISKISLPLVERSLTLEKDTVIDDIIKELSNVPLLKQNKAFIKFIKLSEKLKDVQKVLKEGYEMSIMPLNVLLPIECLWKYIPEADYFSKTPIHVNPDPYGHENYVIKNKNIRLGIHMFRHSFLMDIQSFCPIGCVGCYKTFYTREKGEGHDMGVSKQTLEKQVRETVRWLNNNPEVYDIIISGGEPLLIDYDNNKLAILFNELKKANYLKIVRICTGVIFQGLPFRINEELLEIIKEFCKTTGKRFTFQAHLSNNYQFTPEALWAVKKIREKGFNIYSQVPIQEGINFFREDIEKSLKSFIILGQYQVRAEVEPYKYIVDMHPRTQRRYVPIELLLKIWRKLAESHLYPELERPRTLSILTKQGNIILSWYMLKHMSKEINKEKNEVIYKIPAIVGTKGCEEVKMVEYFEPIIPGINDNPRSLQL